MFVRFFVLESQKWAIGLHTDFVIEKFKVEKVYANDDEKETVERSYPIAPALTRITRLTNPGAFY